jgi:hypothetical protein
MSVARGKQTCRWLCVKGPLLDCSVRINYGFGGYGASVTARYSACSLMAGFGQIEAQVTMVAMVAETTAVKLLVGCYISNLHGFRRCSAARLWCCTNCSG